jgi:hypothetical protein
LNPARLKTNADCLVCGQCLKACQPQNNMGLFLRRPFHASDRRESLASWPVTLFVMLVSGFVAYELCSEWTAAKNVFLCVPTAVSESLGWTAYEGWIKGVWMLFVVPLAMWLVLGGLVLLFRGAGSIGEAWRRLAIPLVVIIAAGHMAKGLAKIVSWGGFMPFALKDPTGTVTASAITSETLAQPSKLLPMSVVSGLSVLLLVVMTYFAFRESHIADSSTHRTRLLPVALIAVASVCIVVGWGL